MYSLDYIISQSIVYYSKMSYGRQYSGQSINNQNIHLGYNTITKNIAYNKNNYNNFDDDYSGHSFAPEIFLMPDSRKIMPKTNDEVAEFAKEAFRLMIGKELDDVILISIHPMPLFKDIHSRFGRWSNGIQGFSINGSRKLVFIRENDLCSMLITIGHEIGHVYTAALPNPHDEEAKAFAFTIEWVKILKKFNVGNVGESIREELNLNPAKNGLHDTAFGFVNFMLRKGRKALDVHNDLVKKYLSIFNDIYLIQ